MSSTAMESHARKVRSFAKNVLGSTRVRTTTCVAVFLAIDIRLVLWGEWGACNVLVGVIRLVHGVLVGKEVLGSTRVCTTTCEAVLPTLDIRLVLWGDWDACSNASGVIQRMHGALARKGRFRLHTRAHPHDHLLTTQYQLVLRGEWSLKERFGPHARLHDHLRNTQCLFGFMG